MSKTYEIRADYDATTLVVYQAYTPQIAEAALKAQKFIAPFSFNRMTWIKPSFLWLMERSNWGLKPNQERILAVRITRAGWEKALSAAVLTHPEKGIYRDGEAWRSEFDAAPVIVQWDPERSIRGAHLQYDSIQVGISRHWSREYAEQWTVAIEDYTPRVRKIHQLLQAGHIDNAKKFLPPERAYPVNGNIAKRLGITDA